MASNDRFTKWIENLDEKALVIWQESFAQLRQLHGDIWNGVRFFVTINSIIIAAMATIVGKNQEVIIFFLGIIGFVSIIYAIYYLQKQREYYSLMLLKKTLLENQLGMYEIKISGIDLSFPWSVPSEEHLKGLLNKPTKWLEDHVWRPKTLSWSLGIMYIFILIVYMSIILITFHSLISM